MAALVRHHGPYARVNAEVFGQRRAPKRWKNRVLSSMQKQTQKRPTSGSNIYLMNSFHLRGACWKYYLYYFLLSTYAIPNCLHEFYLSASHALTFPPEAFASVLSGFVFRGEIP